MANGVETFLNWVAHRPRSHYGAGKTIRFLSRLPVGRRGRYAFSRGRGVVQWVLQNHISNCYFLFCTLRSTVSLKREPDPVLSTSIFSSKKSLCFYHPLPSFSAPLYPLQVGVMRELRKVAVVIDGGLYSGFAEKESAGDDVLRDFLSQIERATGGHLVHVTYADADSQEYLTEHIADGLLDLQPINSLAEKTLARERKLKALEVSLGVNKLDVILSGFARVWFRRPVAPPASTQGECGYERRSGIVQDMCDVDVCVRLFEYAHGLVRCANGTAVEPTDIVLLAKDSDIARAVESVQRTAPNIQVWLAAMCEGGANDPTRDPLDNISRELEAYIPKARRFLLKFDKNETALKKESDAKELRQFKSKAGKGIEKSAGGAVIRSPVKRTRLLLQKRQHTSDVAKTVTKRQKIVGKKEKV